jgi:hypothetical protein
VIIETIAGLSDRIFRRRAAESLQSAIAAVYNQWFFMDCCHTHPKMASALAKCFLAPERKWKAILDGSNMPSMMSSDNMYSHTLRNGGDATMTCYPSQLYCNALSMYDCDAALSDRNMQDSILNDIRQVYHSQHGRRMTKDEKTILIKNLKRSIPSEKKLLGQILQSRPYANSIERYLPPLFTAIEEDPKSTFFCPIKHTKEVQSDSTGLFLQKKSVGLVFNQNTAVLKEKMPNGWKIVPVGGNNERAIQKVNPQVKSWGPIDDKTKNEVRRIYGLYRIER